MNLSLETGNLQTDLPSRKERKILSSLILWKNKDIKRKYSS
jgi:hypothetical protein